MERAARHLRGSAFMEVSTCDSKVLVRRREEVMGFVDRRLVYLGVSVIVAVTLAAALVVIYTNRSDAQTPTSDQLVGPALAASLNLRPASSVAECNGSDFTVPTWAKNGEGYCLPAGLDDAASIGLAQRINGQPPAAGDVERVVISHELREAQLAGDSERVQELQDALESLPKQAP